VSYCYVRVQGCPDNCKSCTIIERTGKPWCDTNGCNKTYAHNDDDGSCVGEFCCLASDFYYMANCSFKQAILKSSDMLWTLGPDGVAGGIWKYSMGTFVISANEAM